LYRASQSESSYKIYTLLSLRVTQGIMCMHARIHAMQFTENSMHKKPGGNRRGRWYLTQKWCKHV